MTQPPSWRAVADSYDGGAAGYDQRHADSAATRARTARLDRALVDATHGAARVLEIGVGTGRLLAQVGARVRIGVDVAAAMLTRAAARGVIAVRADGHALPFADRSFDAIVSGKGSLRYLDPARALAEARRVVRPGGAIAFHLYGGATWSPRRASSRTDATADPGLWQPRSTADLHATLEAAGLREVRIRAFRSIRPWPYLLEIPARLDRALPVQLWSHAIVIARAPSAPGAGVQVGCASAHGPATP